MDEELRTPLLDASSCSQLRLEFADQFLCTGFCTLLPIAGGQTADVDVSTNGGLSWATVLSLGTSTDSYPTPKTRYVDLSPNVSNLKVRFHYVATDGAYWAVDNVKVRCVEPICNVCNP